MNSAWTMVFSITNHFNLRHLRNQRKLQNGFSMIYCTQNCYFSPQVSRTDKNWHTIEVILFFITTIFPSRFVFAECAPAKFSPRRGLRSQKMCWHKQKKLQSNEKEGEILLMEGDFKSSAAKTTSNQLDFSSRFLRVLKIIFLQLSFSGLADAFVTFF